MNLPHAAVLTREFARNGTHWELLASEQAAQRWSERLLLRFAAQDAGEGFAPAGLSRAAAVIAETGSLVLHGGKGHPRRPSLTVLNQIILARSSTVFADLESYLASLSANLLHADFGSHLTLITGPSRTADIEKILVTPAHGPAAVWLGIIDADPSS